MSDPQAPVLSHATEGAAPPRRSRLLVGALVASLAVNLLVLGAVASAAWRFRSPAAANLQFGPANIMSYLSDLPPDRRAALWSQTVEPRRTMGPLRRAVRAARREMANALKAEPFDQSKFQDAQTRLIEAERQQRVTAAKLFSEVAAKLTPDERRSFVRWREKRLPSGQSSDATDTDREPAAAPK
jgi:uncharacterized membrane protein